MLRNWLCQADATIEIEPIDPVLVKSGYATLDGADMAPVSTFRNGERVYYLPGTSLKGVLRSHFERIARTLQPGSVCLPYHDPRRNISVPVKAEQGSYGCGYRSRHGSGTAAAAYADSCAACRLFGSLKFAGRFSIGDAYPLPDHRPFVESRNCVGIDRFTGGTVRDVLFDLQALVGGRFAADIRLTNFELWQLAGLKLLLDDLADELIAVGSGRSRGLGRVRGAVKSFRLTYLRTARTADSLAGIGELSAPRERKAYRLHEWAPESSIGLPSGAAQGLRQQYDLDADWPQLSIGLPSGAAQGLRQQYDLDADWPQLLQPLVPAFEAFLQWHGGPSGTVSADGARHRTGA